MKPVESYGSGYDSYDVRVHPGAQSWHFSDACMVSDAVHMKPVRVHRIESGGCGWMGEGDL